MFLTVNSLAVCVADKKDDLKSVSFVCSMYIYSYCYSCYHEPCLIVTTRAEKVGDLLD